MPPASTTSLLPQKTSGSRSRSKKWLSGTYKYHLKKGNEVVHCGTTNDLDRRQAEHQEQFPGTKIDQPELPRPVIQYLSKSSLGI